MMALIKLAKGEPAVGLQLISAAMQGRKPSPQILLNHGLILNALERHQEAVDSFDAALKQKSKFAEAHNNRGAALASLGRDEEALEAFRKALAINPNYAEAHYNNGSSLRTLGRYEEALKSFDRALALRPNYAKAHNNRGAVLEAMTRNKDGAGCVRARARAQSRRLPKRASIARACFASSSVSTRRWRASTRPSRSIPTTRILITTADASISTSTATTTRWPTSKKRWRSGRISPRRVLRPCLPNCRSSMPTRPRSRDGARPTRKT